MNKISLKLICLLLLPCFCFSQKKENKPNFSIEKDTKMVKAILKKIDADIPFGHIFWSYNPVKKEVNHLSSFGSSRAGVGKGDVNENGDVLLKISFADEAGGTYRKYTYKWVNDNEYILKSIQYNSQNEPTGLFYGGTFVRIASKK